MLRTLILDSKSLLFAIITMIALLSTSFSSAPSQYDWKMNVKYGPSNLTYNNGFIAFGGTEPALRKARDKDFPWASAFVLYGNPAGILARTASFTFQRKTGISALNNLVYWTASDLRKAVDYKCLSADYGNRNSDYEASIFYVFNDPEWTGGDYQRPITLSRLRFSKEIQITGSTGMWAGNGNIDVKLYPADTTSVTTPTTELY